MNLHQWSNQFKFDIIVYFFVYFLHHQSTITGHNYLSPRQFIFTNVELCSQIAGKPYLHVTNMRADVAAKMRKHPLVEIVEESRVVSLDEIDSVVAEGPICMYMY